MWYHISYGRDNQFNLEIQKVMLNFMARQKKPTTNRTTRYLNEIVDALDKYAEDQMISSNAAVNKLLKERLTELGYIQQN
jgi:hypothetical protein